METKQHIETISNNHANKYCILTNKKVVGEFDMREDAIVEQYGYSKE
jgi:hypothetical protein